MEEEVKYTSEFDGQTTDEVLEHAKSVKDLTIPSLSEISGFVCINKEGNAIGMMSKEQVAQVVGGLLTPYQYKGALPLGTDLNTIDEHGIYKLNGTYVNVPFSQSWGTLVVLHNGGGSKTQIITEVTSQYFNIFARKDRSSSWIQIATK